MQSSAALKLPYLYFLSSHVLLCCNTALTASFASSNVEQLAVLITRLFEPEQYLDHECSPYTSLSCHAFGQSLSGYEGECSADHSLEVIRKGTPLGRPEQVSCMFGNRLSLFGAAVIYI